MISNISSLSLFKIVAFIFLYTTLTLKLIFYLPNYNSELLEALSGIKG